MREAEHIPPEEIAAAAEALVAQTFGIRQDELVAEVGRLLGYGRVGSKLKRRIRGAIDRCIADERFTEREGMLYVNE